ncbi:MAG: AMP-binding protein [Cyanobacteria bacterium P01_F01_bin.150]
MTKQKGNVSTNLASAELEKQLANLSPEQRALFEKRLQQRQAKRQTSNKTSNKAQASRKIKRRSGDRPTPLSFAQQRLWFIQQLEPDSFAYNVFSALRLKGALDIAVLEQTLTELVQRHETLRTVVKVGELGSDGVGELGSDGVALDASGLRGQQAIQVVLPAEPITLKITEVDLTRRSQGSSQISLESPNHHQEPWDLTPQPSIQNPKSKIQNSLECLAIAAAQKPFDLTQSLLRLELLRVSEQDHVLLITVHHIISDRWSVGVFLREMTLLYNAYLDDDANGSGARQSPLPELAIQYGDWAVWQRQWLQGKVLEDHIAYWTKQLADVPMLQLPTDRPYPPVPTYRGDQRAIAISPVQSQALKKLAAKEGVTLFILLLAAFGILLHRYSQQDDVTIGTDIANRDRTETQGLIGLLVNTLVLRLDGTGNPSFRDYLQRVKQTVAGAFTYQALPFEKLVEVLNPERNISQMSPLFQAKFDLQLATVKPLALKDMTVERLPLDNHTVKYELRLNLQDSEAGISGQIEYSTDLFDATTIARLIEHFQQLLEAIATNPDQPIGLLSLLTPTERQQLLVDWNQTQRVYDNEVSADKLTIHGLFEQQVQRTPDAIAVIYQDIPYTYRQLDQSANQLAHYIQTIDSPSNRGEELTVGVYLERLPKAWQSQTPQMIVALLAILKAGGAYVPMDPAYPQERIAFMVADADMTMIIGSGAKPNFENWQGSFIDLSDSEEQELISMQSRSSSLLPTNNSSDLAYVIYTSGSTGKPKGVAIEHRNTVAMLQWAQETFDPESTAGVLASTSICFDLSVFEIFLPLTTGGSVILAENVLDLPELSAADQVTLVNTVPSAIAQLIQHHTLPISIRTVNLAGEPLPASLVQALYERPHIQSVYNLYGPSEDTTYSTFAKIPNDALRLSSNTSYASEIQNPKSKIQNQPTPSPSQEGDRKTQSPSIGRPIANSQAYVLDRYLQPVPVGIPGELYLGGAGVARGYLNRPELTQERFIQNPFVDRPDARSQGSLKLSEQSTNGYLEPWDLSYDQKLYKTGDLVRYRPDGQLEFLGRLDQQVKVRGYRIELGEIEAVLRQHPQVQDDIVQVDRVLSNPQDNSEQAQVLQSQRLIAYVIPTDGEEPSTAEVQGFLSKQLPSFMVPGIVMLLEEFPRLPNGKINRRALPSPSTERMSENDYIAPRTELEEAIAHIWQTTLQVDAVGIYDNFFELGGHSLLGLQLMGQVSRQVNQSIPLRLLFQYPTVAQLTEQINGLQFLNDGAASLEARNIVAVELPEITPVRASRHEPFPLTDIQHAYWIGRNEAFELGNISTHGYREIETVGLTVAQLESAFQRLIDRHDMLRVVVQADGQQRVLAEVPPYKIQTTDLRSLPPSQVETELMAMRDRLSHQIIPTDRYPLFDIQASLLPSQNGELGDRIRFHVSFDVLMGDAWSAQLIAQELAQNLLQPKLPQVPIDVTFRDYVLAEEAFRDSETYRQSWDYWQQRLDTLPPAPQLPLAQRPDRIENPRFVRRSGTLAPEAWQAIKQRAAKFGVTPSGVLLAAFADILNTWSQPSSFTLNLTLFNRLPFHPDVNRLVGDFTSSVLLAIHTKANQSFGDLAQGIQDQLWQDLEHRYVSGVQVLRELAQRQQQRTGALMPVVFTSVLTQDLGEAKGDRPWQSEIVYSLSQTSQVYLDHQVSEIGGALHFNWDAIEDLFPDCLLDDMFAAYKDLLHVLAAPESLLWDNPRSNQLLPDRLPQHQRQCLQDLNATTVALLPAADGDVDSTQRSTPNDLSNLLHGLFFNRAVQQPNTPAIITSDGTLTYQDVSDRALTIAQRLLSQDIQVGDCRRHGVHEVSRREAKRVAIVMEKGWEQIVGAIAILTVGAAYVPIAPDLPIERIHQLFQQTQIKYVLTQPQLMAAIDWPDNIVPIPVDDSVGKNLPNVAEIAALGFLASTQPTGQNSTSKIQNSDLAYILYTSGSTGTPKGVMIDHRGAVNTILDINQRFGVGVRDRVLALSSLSFDLSVYDIFGLLAAGGAIVLPDAGSDRDPIHWADLIQTHGVTVWNTVPALMHLLVQNSAEKPTPNPSQEGDRSASTPQLPNSLTLQRESKIQNLKSKIPNSLRLVLLSGDWIPLSLPEQITTTFPNANVISLGGATEASIWSIFHPIDAVDPAWTSIPYGRPLGNQQMYVLNQALESCPVWVSGHIYIGGIGLAQGYWQNEEKTSTSFIRHPETGDRLYRTGDLGRYLPDGTIEFLGRDDFQVKVNGYRIELGEIETALNHHPMIKDVVVTAVGDNPQQQRLVAYVVPEEEVNLQKNSSADTASKLEFKLQQAGVRQFSSSNATKVQLHKPAVETDVYIRRQSHRRFLDTAVGLEPFSQWLGSLMSRPLPQSPLPKYRYASAGSLYPVQAYVYVKPGRMTDLAPGYYYYHPVEHCLIQVSEDSQQPVKGYGTNQEVFDQGAFAVFLVGELDAIAPIYDDKSRDLCLLEAGYISQLLMETAPDFDLGLCPIGALEFAPFQQGFELSESHCLLHSFVGGAIDPEWSQQWQPQVSQSSVNKGGGSGLPSSQGGVGGGDPLAAVQEQLREFLQQTLPSYMVPTHFVPMESLPLTANGKVDRNALPDPTHLMGQQSVEMVAPRTEMEEAIAQIWQQSLQLDGPVSVHENFFNLGGNSLSATQVLAQLRQVFPVELSIRQFFERATIADHAEMIQHLLDTSPAQSESESAEATLEPIGRAPQRSEISDTSLSEPLSEPLPADINLDELSEQDMNAMLQQLLADEASSQEGES